MKKTQRALRIAPIEFILIDFSTFHWSGEGPIKEGLICSISDN